MVKSVRISQRLLKLQQKENVASQGQQEWRHGSKQPSNHEPAVCPGCQEGQWSPGVHQEECGQQVEEGSSSPLLCPSEAPSAVLCPVPGSPVQEM